MNVKTIFLFALGPVGSAGLSLLSVPVVAWIFSMEDVGKIAMLQVVTGFCMLIFTLGLDQAYVREYHESSDKDGLLKMAVIPGFSLLIIALITALSFPGILSKTLFDVNDTSFSLMVSVCILSVFFSRFLSLVVRMEAKGLAYSLGQLSPKLVFLLTVLLLYYLPLGLNLADLLLTHTISLMCGVLVYILLTYKSIVAGINRKINPEKMKEMLKFGSPLILGGAAFWGLTAIDKVFIRYFSTFEELALYSVATNFAAIGIILQSVFSTVWAPTVYKWAAEGVNLQKIDEVIDYVLVIVIATFSVIGTMSWIVPMLLPEEYKDVQYLMVVCMGYPLLYTLSEATVVGLGIKRRSDLSMIASCGALLANVGLNFYLIPLFGASGAAASTAISFLLFLVLRTEFSVIVWRSFPRLNLYLLSTLCVAISIVAISEPYAVYGWLLVVVWLFLSRKHVFVKLTGLLRSRKIGI